MSLVTGAAFYWFNIALGRLIPLVIFAFVWADWVDPMYGRGFVLGCALGLPWELPLPFLGPVYTGTLLLSQASARPQHRLTQPFIHSLWDGGLFIIALGLLVALRGSIVFQSVNPGALAMLPGWDGEPNGLSNGWRPVVAGPEFGGRTVPHCFQFGASPYPFFRP